jgi:SAM-dependent methyltransferase
MMKADGFEVRMSYPHHPFDRRVVEPVDVKTGYAIWSRNYDAMLTGNLEGPVLKTFEARLGGVEGDAVDLGAGTGRMASWVLERTPCRAVDGVDLSPEMTAVARARNAYRRLQLADMRRTGLAGGRYALALNVLSACHVERLEPLYDEARRLLEPGGFFALIDFHPHMLLCGKGTCFPDTEGNPTAIVNHVHLLSDHARAAEAAGFAYEAFDESVVTRAWIDGGLVLRDFLHHTIGFGFLWKKAGGGPGTPSS